LPFNGSQGFYSPYGQRPGTLTTFGRWEKQFAYIFQYQTYNFYFWGSIYSGKLSSRLWLFPPFC
jgi:hypothetical protein